MTTEQRLEKQRKRIVLLESRLKRAKQSADLWKHRYFRDVPRRG